MKNYPECKELGQMELFKQHNPKSDQKYSYISAYIVYQSVTTAFYKPYEVVSLDGINRSYEWDNLKQVICMG